MFRWGWPHVIGAAVLVGGAAGVSWTHLGYSSLRALQEDLAGLIAAHNTQDGERPVLRGEPLPGNAWDSYKESLSGLKGSGYIAGLHRQNLKSHSVQVEFVRLHEASLQAMVHGARQRQAKLPLGAHGVPVDAAFNSLHHWHYYLNLLAHCHVEKAWRSGDFDTALDTLFAWNTFRLDLARIRPGLQLGNWAEISLLEFLNSGSLDVLHLRALGSDLERLEKALPSRAVRLRQLQLNLALDLLNDERQKRTFFRFDSHALIGSSSGMLWNSPFGSLSSLRLMQRLAGQAVSWEHLPREEQRLKAEEARLAHRGRPQAWVHAPQTPLSSPAWELKEMIQIRLLRALACALAGDPLPPDPYGGELRHFQEHGLLRVWSVGADGRDDDGRSGSGADDPCLELHFS